MTVDLQGACFAWERGSSSLILRVATFFCWLSWVRRAERKAKGYAWEAEAEVEAVSIRLEFSMSWDGFGLPWLPLGGSLIGVIRTRSPAESSVCNRICRTSWKNALRLQFAFVNWSFVFSLSFYLCSCSCCSCFPYAGHAPFWHMPRVARASCYLDTRCNQHELLSSMNSSSSLCFLDTFWGLPRLSQWSRKTQ